MHAPTHAHTHSHVHTGFRRNTGTHRNSLKVIQCRKFTHQNILLGSLHNSSSRRQQGAWRGLVGLLLFVTLEHFRTLRLDGADDDWKMVMILDDLACRMREVWERRMYHMSVRLSVSNTLHTPPSGFSSQRTKKSKSLYVYFWNHSLTFHLSKYIVYIMLEYIKYRIGTIPSIPPEYFLYIYSNSCCK